MIIDVNLIQNLLLGVFAVAVLGAIVFSIKNGFKKEKHIEHQEEKPISGYKNIIKEAHVQAKSLLYETTVEAASIISGAKRTNEHAEEQLDKVMHSMAAEDIHLLKTTTQEYDKNYQKNLESVQQQIGQVTQEALDNTKKAYDERLEKFTDELLASGLSTQTIVDKKTAELLLKADSEIAEYKKAQLEAAGEQVKNLVEKAYRDILRTTIPPNIHQDLIIKALDNAKKDGMFKL